MNVLNKTILVFSMAIGLVGGKIQAQQSLIDVKLDSAAILIGEQTKLHLSVTADKDRPVQIVIPADTLMRGVEVLEVSKPDSSVIENNRLVIKQDLLITSFDSALYLLPPLKVIDGADTVYSNQVALKVSTVPVNVDKPEEFYDIKDVWKPPFVWADYYPIIYGVLLGLLLLCVIIYVIKRLKNRKSILPFSEPAEPKLPPFEQAMKELDALKEKKLWQQGLNKEYHTALTETLRRYIVDRFGVNAMEMTSGEILDILRGVKEAAPVYDKLQQILGLADFVKFAKLHPLPDENDRSMTNAYLFVTETKPEEVIPEKEASEATKGEEEKQSETNDSKIKE